MPFVPTPPGSLPDPDVIKTWLDPEQGEGSDGYITPDDLKDVVQALASYDAAVQTAAMTHADEADASIRGDLTLLADEVLANTAATGLLTTEIGNIHLLGQADLVAAILALEARVTTLENDPGTQPPAPKPTSEGRVLIDKYSTTFVRARAEAALDLSDGHDHWFTFALAGAGTVGPGGEVITNTPALEAIGGVVWFDNGGSLGHVKATTGSDLTVTALSQFITGHRLAQGHLDLTTEPGHPRLVLVQVLT
jgi:hypothetical protein